MKKRGVYLALCFLACIHVSGCGREEQSSDIANNDYINNTNSSNTNERAAHTSTEKASIQVDESQYSRDELKAIQLLNLSIQYRNEENKVQFMKLLSSASNVGQPNS